MHDSESRSNYDVIYELDSGDDRTERKDFPKNVIRNKKLQNLKMYGYWLLLILGLV